MDCHAIRRAIVDGKQAGWAPSQSLMVSLGVNVFRAEAIAKWTEDFTG
jgi:hypothetical protein